MKLWQIVAVVAAGVVYGIAQPGKLTYAFGHATLYILLPALLFEGAWNLNFRAMKRTWAAIATLAVPGVVLTALLIAGALSVARVPFGVALLTGAILSATDPVAVIAIFRRQRVSLSLSTIVECESLFNDGVAVVLYRAVVLVIAQGFSGWSLLSVTLVSIGGSLGGVAIGIAMAYVLARVLRRRNEENLQIVVTILCAYGSYFAAEALQCSGIFATIACGIALRYYERAWITLTIVRDVDWFWQLAALVANVLVFFLVGAALNIVEIVRYPAFVLATIAGVAVARFGTTGLLLPAGFPEEWLDVLRAAGIRGGLSLALAIALPASIPYRGEIVAATFAVALATIAFSALTVPRVVKKAVRRG